MTMFRCVVEHNPVSAAAAVAKSRQPVSMQDQIRIDVPLEMNIPTLTDMATVAWQTIRWPKQGKHLLNRIAEGTNVHRTNETDIQYLSESFVKKHFSGVLKVTVHSIDGSVAGENGVNVYTNECIFHDDQQLHVSSIFSFSVFARNRCPPCKREMVGCSPLCCCCRLCAFPRCGTVFDSQ